MIAANGHIKLTDFGLSDTGLMTTMLRQQGALGDQLTKDLFASDAHTDTNADANEVATLNRLNRCGKFPTLH
jgi:hypothetical protein